LHSSHQFSVPDLSPVETPVLSLALRLAGLPVSVAYNIFTSVFQLKSHRWK